MKIPVTPPEYHKLLTSTLSSPDAAKRLPEILAAGVGPAQNGKYRHWDTLRHLKPPRDLTPEEHWLAVKLARQTLLQTLPLKDRRGEPFRYALPSSALEMLHTVDRDASGSVRSAEGGEQILGTQARDTYLIKSLVEEAITSSQLEGASTTREAAKDMIRQGREPKDRSERMILNNYRAMQFVRRFTGEELTPSIILELQEILTDGTLDTPDAAGRLRRADEPIQVEDETGRVLHTPPPAIELEKRMRAMSDFANDRSPDAFVHPVARAIILHFWLAYDHPFVDGNGRTARALFYWSMARDGYWLIEFISISRILRKARARYARSFLYTETDDNDVTYFLLHQLKAIRQAIADLHDYLGRKLRELRRTEELLRRNGRLRTQFNARQLALLNHALKNPGAVYTLQSHRQSHNISYETARTDLLDLATQGFLTQAKTGRQFQFGPSKDLGERVAL